MKGISHADYNGSVLRLWYERGVTRSLIEQVGLAYMAPIIRVAAEGECKVSHIKEANQVTISRGKANRKGYLEYRRLVRIGEERRHIHISKFEALSEEAFQEYNRGLCHELRINMHERNNKTKKQPKEPRTGTIDGMVFP